MEASCLDIDAEDHWGPVYGPWFADLASAEVWNHLYDPEEYANSESRVRSLCRRIAPPRRWKYHWVRSRAVQFMKANYTHVACYHSCRIVDEKSYLTHGLLPSDVDLLDREAETLFGRSNKLRQSIMGARSDGYRAHNHGGVYVFAARSGALHYGGHYRSYGSEYLGRISGALGEAERSILRNRGRGAIVRCVIPIGELLAKDMRFMSMLPLYHKLTVREPVTPPGLYAVQGGFKHSVGIPAVRISIEYIDDEDAARIGP